MSRKAEVRELIAVARAAGYTVERARRNNHWKIRDADGRLMTTLPSSPDGPFRERAVADFKRLGIIDCDPKRAGQRKRES